MADDKSKEPSKEPPVNSNGMENIRQIYTSEERTEYFGKLEKWLQEAYAWQSVAAMFPYHLLSGQITPQVPGLQQFIGPISTNVGSVAVVNTTPLIAGTPDWQNIEPVRQRTPQEPRVPFQPPRAEGYEYRIPPIWKRFVAEFIDNLILFLLKLVITFFTLDLFTSLRLEPHHLDVLLSNLRIDYKMAVEVASRLLIWEMMHLCIDCMYEAFWLQHGMNGTIGGASPGKFFMGLIVVQCRSITPIERPDSNDMVFVSPGSDLGLPLAVGRSVVKNLITTFLFPMCFGLFHFRFNRTVYDLACNSIVVEDSLRNTNNRPRRQ